MTQRTASNERLFPSISGWPVAAFHLASVAFLLWRLIPHGPRGAFDIALLVAVPLLLVLGLPGYFIVNPNVSRVLVLFGKYRGTVRSDGFHWTNPFTMKHTVSLRAHNHASQKIKVNDMLGNPIEIGAVIVWQVRDTAQATFDVADYTEYVDVQTEAAVRNLANHHPYDDSLAPADVTTLRGDTEKVAAELEEELQRRFHRAGIQVLEARISHLAYAPEIASAMLQRQQAAAIIAARAQIVEGAVSMVEHALQDLGKKQIVELDAERRATLVGNLMVVLCGHSNPIPVLNAGSL